MWLHEDMQRTARIANARQESRSWNIERPELGRPARGHDPRHRGFKIIDLKQYLPSRRGLPAVADWQQSADCLLAAPPNDVERVRCKRLLRELPSKET